MCRCGGRHSRRGAYDRGDHGKSLDQARSDMLKLFSPVILHALPELPWELADPGASVEAPPESNQSGEETADADGTFPTEARLRQRAAHHEAKAKAAAAGETYTPKRLQRPPAEQHFDDCGMDMTSIELQEPDNWFADSEQGLWQDRLPPLTMETELGVADFVDVAGFFHGAAGMEPQPARSKGRD